MNREDTFSSDDELADITGGTSDTPAASLLGTSTHSVEVEEPDIARFEEPGLQRLTPEEANRAHLNDSDATITAIPEHEAGDLDAAKPWIRQTPIPDGLFDDRSANQPAEYLPEVEREEAGNKATEINVTTIYDPARRDRDDRN